MTLTTDVRTRARQVIAARTGLDFPEERASELDRALLEGVRDSPAGGAEAYVSLLERLAADTAEWTGLISRLTVGETYFFRDSTFDALEQHVLPVLIERREREGSRRLRLWSAGCSTGEEPYSLAMLVDRLLAGREDWTVTILGTDLNPSSLATARAGIYREWSLRSTPEWARRRYFRALPAGRLELDGRVRQMVAFASINLAEDGYPSLVTNSTAMDLVLCRNVLMYLTAAARRDATARLQEALVHDGLLAVSAVEAAAELLRPFEPVQIDGTILFRKPPAKRKRSPGRVPPRTAAVRRRRRPPVAPAPTAAPQPDRAALLEQARRQAGRGHLGRARDLCDKALSSDRLDVEAHLLLAAIHREAGDPPAALDAARRAVYLAPDLPAAHFLLGGLLIARGDAVRGRRSMGTVAQLLRDAAPAETVPGTDGLAAGQVCAIARSLVEAA